MRSSCLLLAVLCVLFRSEDTTTCRHARSGDAVPVNLGAVRKAHESVAARFAWSTEKASVSLDDPFDSGLPACPSRRKRIERVEIPRELVGRTFAFAPADRLPPADFQVATSGRHLKDIEADALAEVALAERLKVRCAPTLVTVRSESEIELLENP